MVLVLLKATRRSVEVILEPLRHERNFLDPLRPCVWLSLLKVSNYFRQDFLSERNVVIRLPQEARAIAAAVSLRTRRLIPIRHIARNVSTIPKKTYLYI